MTEKSTSRHTHRGPRHRARKRAVQALYQWHVTGQEVGEILAQFSEMQSANDAGGEYFETLVRRVVEHADALDGALAPFIERSAAQVDPVERSVLRLAAWELRECPEVPWRVVLDEAVELAHVFGATHGHSFVNAVLDRAVRAWRPDEIAG